MKRILSVLDVALLCIVFAMTGLAVAAGDDGKACDSCVSCANSASCDSSASCSSVCGEPVTDTATLAETDSAEDSCASDVSSAAAGDTVLSSEELERVADYMVEQILATGTTSFEQSEVEEATRIFLDDAAGALLRPLVMEKLSATEAGRTIFANSRCQAYEACSLYGNLSGATGDILAMYEREKAEDGRVFDNFKLPEFAALDLAGREVSSTALSGQPVLLAFVAVHCRHSMDSLPILQKLTETYGPKGLRVVAVAINSGEVQDVNTWFPSFDPKYEVWVSSGDGLGDQIGSHLVPTYLFVDADGQITEKLVGYQEPFEITDRVLARLAARHETQEITSR